MNLGCSSDCLLSSLVLQAPQEANARMKIVNVNQEILAEMRELVTRVMEAQERKKLEDEKPPAERMADDVSSLDRLNHGWMWLVQKCWRQIENANLGLNGI